MKPLKISLLNFKCFVLQSELPSLVLFGAIWDAKSRLLLYELNRVAEKYDQKLITGFADYDYVPDIFSDYDIGEIPTMIIFEDGKPFKKVSGFTNVGAMQELLNYFFGVLPY